MKYITQKEREQFIESLADNTFPHSWRCEKHNCLVRVGNRCPECYAEESLKRQGEEAVRLGLFGKMNKITKPEEVAKIREELENKNRRWNKMNTALKIKKLKTDTKYREEQNKLKRKYSLKKKIRRLEHSI